MGQVVLVLDADDFRDLAAIRNLFGGNIRQADMLDKTLAPQVGEGGERLLQ
ncbi:hypothetical protein D3C72_1520970 [compost metagenome]